MIGRALIIQALCIWQLYSTLKGSYNHAYTGSIGIRGHVIPEPSPSGIFRAAGHW